MSRCDRILVWSLRITAFGSGALILLMAFFLLLESLPALRQIPWTRFLSDSGWHPGEGMYSLAPMLAGSLMAMAGSVLLAAPLGIASALFCHFYAPPPLAWSYRRLIELLAGIPSVVFGFWGLVVLVPLLGRIQPPGTSLLAGILILTLMILPTAALIADTGLGAVPGPYLQGAAALGLGRWAMLRHIVLPSARPALITGLVLASGRAIGETMAVLMVCGNVVALPRSLFQPMRTLTANIALEMSYALGLHRSALFVTGLLLLLLVALLAGAAEIYGREKLHV